MLLEGWGEISFKNLIEAINKSKKISLDKFIYSLGIRYIGETNASILAYEFLSIRNLIKRNKSQQEYLNKNVYTYIVKNGIYI